MATTLFAIFAIALVATLAWIISRIVNIFVELEELREQAKDITERVSNHCKKVNDLREEMERIKTQQEVHYELTTKAIEDLKEWCDALQKCTETPEEFNLTKMTPQEVKTLRLKEYIDLRCQGLSIRKAGEEVGVSYATAKRYEKQRNALQK